MNCGFNILFLLGFFSVSTLLGQNEITNIVTIPLYHPTTSDSSSRNKWGIYLTIGGGSTPALFELDTGGTGFYAAYAPNSSSHWWGTNFSFVNNQGTNLYESGLYYIGNVVSSAITFWTNSSGSSGVTTPTNVLIGQSTAITDNGAVFWTNTGSTTTNPPIQNAFYGDFGLSLKSSSNALVNLIAQMIFTNGIIPGFKLNTPLQGTNAYLQIGLSAGQTNEAGFNYFAMNPDTNNSGTFNNNTNISYQSEALLSTTLAISNNVRSLYTTNIDVIADTGAHPNLHYATNTPSDEINKIVDTNVSGGAGEYYLKDNLHVTFTATNINGVLVTVQDFTTTTNTTASNAVDFYASNQAAVMAGAITNTNATSSYNAGLFFFNQHQVTYNLQNGTVGLSPLAVPEPSAAWLLLAGLGLFLLRNIFLSSTAQSPSRKQKILI